MRIWEIRESRKIGKLESPRKWEMLESKAGKLENEGRRNERPGKWKMGNAEIEAGKIRERGTKKRKDKEMENGKLENTKGLENLKDLRRTGKIKNIAEY